MCDKRYVYLYPNSHVEAKQKGQTQLWRESHKENISCKYAIEEAIRKHFDGMFLKHNCAQGIINQFGTERVNWVLSNTIQQKNWDGRFSHENKEWARQTKIPSEVEQFDFDLNMDFVVESHPAVLDGFIYQYRRECEQLESI